MGQVRQAEVRVPHIQRAVKIPVAVRRVEGHGGNGPAAIAGEVLVDLVKGGLVQPGGGSGGHVQRHGVLGAVLVNDDPQGAFHLVVPVVAGPEGDLQRIPVLRAAGGPEDQLVDAVAVPPVGGVIEPLPGQLILGEVGVAGDADLAAEGGVGVAGDELNVVQGPAGVGQVLIRLVEVAAAEGDGAAGGHPVDHLSVLLAVLVDGDAEGAVVIGIAVIEPDGHDQLVSHFGPAVRPEAEGVQGVFAVVAAVGVEAVIVQVVGAEGAVSRVNLSVEVLIVAAHGKIDGLQDGAVIAELLVSLLEPGRFKVHRAAGGHPQNDVGGVCGRAGEGEGAGDLVAVLICGGVGHAEAVGGAGNIVDIAGQVAIAVLVIQGVLPAAVAELAAAASGGEFDGGEAVLSGQGAKHGGHLAADVRAHQLAAGGAHGQGGVLPRGVQAVDGGISSRGGDGGPGGAHHGLVPVAGIGNAALDPAHEGMAAGDGAQRGVIGNVGGIGVLAHLLRGVGAGAHPVCDGIRRAVHLRDL